MANEQTAPREPLALPAGARAAPRVTRVGKKGAGRARRYRYRRRHTPHFYLVVAGLSCAAFAVALKAVAYVNGSVVLATVCFAVILVTALLISAAFFWGFFMLMDGNIPAHRLKVLVPHAAVGVLSPLLYSLNITVDLDGVGSQPVSGLSLACSVACLGLLCVQFRMGRAVVRPEPLRLLRRSDSPGQESGRYGRKIDM